MLLKSVASAGAHVAKVIRAVAPPLTLLGLHLLFDVRIGMVGEAEEPLLALGQIADCRRPAKPIPVLV